MAEGTPLSGRRDDDRLARLMPPRRQRTFEDVVASIGGAMDTAMSSAWGPAAAARRQRQLRELRDQDGNQRVHDSPIEYVRGDGDIDGTK